MARRLKALDPSTPDEDKFFADQKAADAGNEEETESEPETEDEQTETTEGEVEAEPEGEAAAESQDEAEPAGRRVPIGELYAERDKRRKAAEEAESLKAKIAQLEATFEKVVQRMGQPTSTGPTEPDIPPYETDPVGHLKAQIDRLVAGQTQTTQHFAQQSALEQFGTALGGLETQMRTTTPDYDQAVEFAKQARLKDLEALGFRDPAQRLEALRREILSTAAYAMQSGQNPAEIFYNFAKTRGWNGTKEPSVKPVTKLAAVAKGQAAAKSLPHGGTALPPALTLESLSEMEDTDFDKNFDRFWKRT